MKAIQTITRHPATIEHITAEARNLLAELVTALRLGQATAAQFAASRGLIAALPLATREFALLDLRIANARQYYADGEIGAAAYELGLARRSLARVA
jgi:hypothetical protein